MKSAQEGGLNGVHPLDRPLTGEADCGVWSCGGRSGAETLISRSLAHARHVTPGDWMGPLVCGQRRAEA